MTAFNNTQPDHSSHKFEADEEEAPATPLSQPCSPSSWDSGISLLDAQKKLHFCERSCNEEACRSLEGKHISSGSSVVCRLCSERLPDVPMSKQEVLCLLNRELEQERIAAESSANEAISMILRLQVEKAALQMEARHYQQVLEAKTLYDEETISQLQAIISSQEANRLVLEQEIEECREALRKYSEIVTEEGCSGCEEFGKGCVMASTDPIITKKTLCRTPSRGSGGSLRPLSLEEKFNHVAMQTMEDAQQLEWLSLDTKDEAKTKYVVSMSTSDPTLIVDPGNSALDARAMTHGAALRMQDHQNGSVELELGTQEKFLDAVVKDCWLSILMQLSKLYKQILKIETLGTSSFDGDCTLTKCQGYSFDSGNGISHTQQKFPMDCLDYVKWDSCAPAACQKEGYILSPKLAHQNLECKMEMLPSMLNFDLNNNNCKSLHQQGKVGNAQVRAPMNSWCDMMAITDGCITNLAEKFATCQNRFHALEATRRAMKEALEITKENKWKADKVLMIAADMMRDFLSFIGLGVDILDLLHNLMTHLTMIVKVVEDVECAETDLSSKLNTLVMKQDDTLAADGKEPETVFSLIRHDSDSPREMDWKMSKLAHWWSYSFEWLSNEKCRAETAFSGWDHI